MVGDGELVHGGLLIVAARGRALHLHQESTQLAPQGGRQLAIFLCRARASTSIGTVWCCSAFAYPGPGNGRLLATGAARHLRFHRLS